MFRNLKVCLEGSTTTNAPGHNKCLEAEARDSQWQRAFPAGRFRGSAEPLANVVTWNSIMAAKNWLKHVEYKG